MNLGKHIYGSQQHILIPETHYVIAVGFNLARSHFVICDMLCMLPAIEFHHEMRLNTGEVRNVTDDWILMTKLENQ